MYMHACNGHRAIVLLNLLFIARHNLAFPSFIYFQKVEKIIKQPPSSPPSPPDLPLIGLSSHPNRSQILSWNFLHIWSSPPSPNWIYVWHSRFICFYCHWNVQNIWFQLLLQPKISFPGWYTLWTFGVIAAPYGDYWKFMKKFCVTELLGMRHIERSCSVRREELMQLLSKLLRKATDNG